MGGEIFSLQKKLRYLTYFQIAETDDFLAISNTIAIINRIPKYNKKYLIDIGHLQPDAVLKKATNFWASVFYYTF